MITGSLQIKKGYYYAVLNIVNPDGKRIQKWISTKLSEKGNKRKAQKKLIELQNQYENNSIEEIQSHNNNDTIKQNLLFCDYMTNWLEKQKYTIEENTYIIYHYNIHGKIFKYFNSNKIKLTELKAKHLQDFYDYLLSQGLTGNTVKHYHANITKALRQAVINDYIPFNPAERINTIKILPYNANYYSKEELEKALKIFEHSTIKTPLILILFYGLRRSEALGLKWENIDFYNKSITIKTTISREKINGKRQFLIKERTKSKAGYRTLPLIPLAEKVLKEEYEKQQSHSSEENEFSKYVCQNYKGELIKPDYLTRTFKKLLQINKMKVIRLHDLRHSCATLLIQNGIQLKDIQLWLGHSNYQTTLRYSHLEDKNKLSSANLINNIFS